MERSYIRNLTLTLKWTELVNRYKALYQGWGEAFLSRRLRMKWVGMAFFLPDCLVR
jgi:hypothetical protein